VTTRPGGRSTTTGRGCDTKVAWKEWFWWTEH